MTQPPHPARVREVDDSFHVREAHADDLPGLIELTIDTFRPLFEQTWPALIPEAVFQHDHHDWQQKYHRQLPRLLDPDNGRHITVAHDPDGRLLGFVAWIVTSPDAGTLDLVATAPTARGRGIARQLCETALDRMKSIGVRVVHIGTGGDEFHAPARHLYESLGFSGLPVVDYSREL